MLAEEKKRPVIFGEVLYDRFPDGSVVLGGAPFNVAWHLQAFGVAPLFISRVGRDELGESIGEAMQNWGLDMTGLQWDDNHATGTVEVKIENDEPKYEIVDKRAYDFISGDELPLVTSALLYHGTLALRNEVSASALNLLKLAHPPVFLDVNLRPPWWSHTNVSLAMKDTKWIKLNQDELTLLETEPSDLNEKAYKFLKRNNLSMLIVTRGAHGAVAFYDSGSPDIVAPSSSQTVVDTVGAGDAFTSVVLAGLLKKWPIKLTLQRAQEFATAVVGLRGATTQDKDFYGQFIQQWRLAES